MSTLVIFDLDGTVLRLGEDRQSLETLRELMYGLFTYEKPGTRSIFKMYSYAEANHRDLLPSMDDMINDYESRVWRSGVCLLSPDRVREIARAYGADSMTALVTNNGRRMVDLFLSSKCKDGYGFDRVVTRNEMTHLKPSATSIHMLVGSFGERFDRVVFIGDSDSDEEALNSFAGQSESECLFIHVSKFL
jgi:FMN phosphatase YigB (HAD superfamily)